jgi:hypothetical protein
MSLINYVVTQFDKQIGSGILQQARFPTYAYYDYGYFAQIYTSQELGVGSPVYITAIRYRMIGNSATDISSINQTLKLGQVNSDRFEVGVQNQMIQVPFVSWLASNIQTVKSNFTWTVPEDYNDWLEVVLDTPYLFDPSLGNLLILWESRDGSYIGGTISSPYARSTDSSGIAKCYYDEDDNVMPSLTSYGSRDNVSRPNIQIKFQV